MSELWPLLFSPTPMANYGRVCFFFSTQNLLIPLKFPLISNNPQPPARHCVCVCVYAHFLWLMNVCSRCICVRIHLCLVWACVCVCVCVITRGSYWISSQCRGRLRNFINRHVPRQTRTDTQCTCHYTVTQDGCLCRQATHAPVYVEQGRAHSCKHTLSVYRLPTCASSLRAPTGLTLTDGSRRQAHMPTYYTEKLCCALDTSSSWEFSEMWRIEAVCF